MEGAFSGVFFTSLELSGKPDNLFASKQHTGQLWIQGMSYEQFVKYKQQLSDITAEFPKAANMLDDDQLAIVVARMVVRVSDTLGKAFQDKYRGWSCHCFVRCGRQEMEVER